jgi:hypothetical protein
MAGTWTTGASIAWTGDELVVLAAGAAWDPAAGRWRELPDDPAGLVDDGSGRAVWTSRDLVLVGHTGRSWVAEAYDPATGSWAALPPPDVVGAPLDTPLGARADVDGSVLVVSVRGTVARLAADRSAWIAEPPVPGADLWCSLPDPVPLASEVDEPAAHAVAVCGGGLAVRQPDGSWVVHAGPPSGWVDRVVATPFGLVAWMDAFSVWGRPAPGDVATVLVGQTTVDATGAAVAMHAEPPPSDDDEVIDPAAPRAVVAELTFADGARCTIEEAWNGDAAVVLRELAALRGVVVVDRGPDREVFGAVALPAADGVTLAWGDERLERVIRVTCPDEATARAVAGRVSPPRSPAPLPAPG